MDVVLLKEVKRLGPEGTVVSVKPGYARNYLLPNGLAALATAQALKALEAVKRRQRQQATHVTEQALALKQQLEAHAVTLPLSLGEDDKPFGSVTTHDVVQALAQAHITVDKHAIRLERPIKTLGTYEVPVRVHPDVTATLTLQVVKA